jgi:hypothetical protein
VNGDAGEYTVEIEVAQKSGELYFDSVCPYAESHFCKHMVAAALLVVPKSLIFNWQRESEKFTPRLRFLEYMGNFRNKDTSVFNEYDVVLTTYGTMLRDIEILRGYKFSMSFWMNRKPSKIRWRRVPERRACSMPNIAL